MPDVGHPATFAYAVEGPKVDPSLLQTARQRIRDGRVNGGGDLARAARAAADVFYPMPSGIREVVSHFVYKLPFEYLSCHIAHERGASFLGFNDSKRQEVNFRQIFGSAQAQSAA